MSAKLLSLFAALCLLEDVRYRFLTVRRGVVRATPRIRTRLAHAAFDPATQVMATDVNRLV